MNQRVLEPCSGWGRHMVGTSKGLWREETRGVGGREWRAGGHPGMHQDGQGRPPALAASAGSG